MNIYKKFWVVFVCIFVQPVMGMDFDPVITEVSLDNNNRSLLIFLDDSEGVEGNDPGQIIGGIYTHFIGAFSQQVGPIIVSASVLNDARVREQSEKIDIARYDELKKRGDTLSDVENIELKNIYKSLVPFDKKTAAQWM